MLQEAVERVAIEAMPTTRLSWRRAVEEKGATLGCRAAEVGIQENELRPSAEAPDPNESDSPTDYDARRERWLAEHSSREGLLRALAEDSSGSDIDALIKRLADTLSSEDLDEVADRLRGGDFEARGCTRLAQQAALLKHRAQAERLARLAIEAGKGRDWLPQWGGGPVLDALEVVAESDGSAASELAYIRFSEVALSDDLFLQGCTRSKPVPRGLSRRRQSRHRDGRRRTSRLGLLEDVPLADLAEPPADDNGLDPLTAVAQRFLEQPFTLPLECIQRLLLRGLRASLPEAVRMILVNLEPGLGRGGRPLRVLAVLAAAAQDGIVLPDPVVERVGRLLGSDDLLLRATAQRLLGALGRPVCVLLRGGSLPATLRLHLPTGPKPAIAQGGQTLGADSLDEMLGWMRPHVRGSRRREPDRR